MASHLSGEGEARRARGRQPSGSPSTPAGMTRRQALFLAFILRKGFISRVAGTREDIE